MEIIEQTEQRLRLCVRNRARAGICTLDRSNGTAEVARFAFSLPYRRKRIALSNIADVTVRRRRRRKNYRAVLEVRHGEAISIGDYDKEEALEAARAIRDFLRMSK